MDADGDGHTAQALGGDDCNDGYVLAHPGAVELCGTLRDEDCDGEVDEEGTNALRVWDDLDGDGFGDASRPTTSCALRPGLTLTWGDCDDGDRNTHPAAPERCNGADDDCDGEVDEGAPPQAWYVDADGDGFGAESGHVIACQPPAEGWLPLGGDCDDGDSAIRPDAFDLPYDGVDADCDSASDFDLDRDGHPVPDDCDDLDPAIHPGAPEVFYDATDDDCLPDNDFDADGDGLPGPSGPAADCDDTRADVGPAFLAYVDADGDGFGDEPTARLTCALGPAEVRRAGDCDDARFEVRPGVADPCDGVDTDCDAAVDEDGWLPWWPDLDGDAQGDFSAAPMYACEAPLVGGFPAQPDDDDCDDARADVYRDAPEQCDGQDNDCDALVDDAVGPWWYPDADGDGYGLDVPPVQACALPGHAESDGDCDDARADVHPAAEEVCDGADNDCDADVDEGLLVRFYPDADADGWGDLVPGVWACPGTRPGDALRSGDCDDLDPAVRPDQTETCNGVDDDCDSEVDEELLVDWFRDGDRDGWGDPSTLELDCPGARTAPWITQGGDCDDADRRVNPGRAEACNHVDDDCSGVVDDGLWVTAWYDGDRDGFGVDGVSQTDCPSTFAGGPWAERPGDCDDTTAAANPDQVEVCDHLDNDCDLGVDEDVTVQLRHDADGDGFGAVGSPVTLGCVGDLGYAESTNDCNDARADIHPGAVETCDGEDNNCAAGVDEGVKTRWRLDADADGYWPTTSVEVEACAAPAGHRATSVLLGANDCNDSRADIRPGAVETCDGEDDNCVAGIDEGVTTTWRQDADMDGHAAASTTDVVACTAPSPAHAPAAQVPSFNDCDDTREEVHPGATELCDGLDNDCAEQYGEPIEEIRTPSICGASWARVISGSLYYVPTGARAYALWEDGFEACQTHASHLIVPDGLGVGSTGSVGTYTGGDFEVATVYQTISSDSAITGHQPSQPTSLGIRGGCSFPSGAVWGYTKTTITCEQRLPPLVGGQPALPPSWSTSSTQNSIALQRRRTGGGPIWTLGSPDNWEIGSPTSSAANTICEREIPSQ